MTINNAMDYNGAQLNLKIIIKKCFATSMPHTSIPPYVKLKDPVISDLDIFSSVPFK
jgi:hypothetical protein